MGFYSHIPSWDWFVDPDDRHFPTFLPDDEESVSAQLRGILDDSFDDAVGADDYRKLGFVWNVDAMVMFIKFDGFASAFFDMGMFTSSENTDNDIIEADVTMLRTVGIEGYVIFDKYPSYPIRASFGANLDDLIAHADGTLGFNDIEYELALGMGLHY